MSFFRISLHFFSFMSEPSAGVVVLCLLGDGVDRISSLPFDEGGPCPFVGFLDFGMVGVDAGREGPATESGGAS